MQRCQQTDEWLCVLDASVEVMRKCGGEPLHIDPEVLRSMEVRTREVERVTHAVDDLLREGLRWRREGGPR